MICPLTTRNRRAELTSVVAAGGEPPGLTSVPPPRRATGR